MDERKKERRKEKKKKNIKSERNETEWYVERDERMAISDDVNGILDGWVIIKMVNILQVRLQFVGKSILFLSTTNQPRHAEECRTV